VCALLEEALQDAIRRVLPQSVLSQSVMQDVDFAAVDAVDERAAEDEMRVGWDVETNSPVSFIRPAAEIERERNLTRTTLRLANHLVVEPDTDNARHTEADHLVPEVIDVNTMVQAGIAATLAISLRDRLPIYCDDRVLRELYRQAGVLAFGTIALLEVLERRGTITSADRQAAVATLEAAGAIDLSSGAARS
jgi:hypothetical protein